MEPFSFSIPENIIVGAGVLDRIGEEAGKIGGKKALIITGPRLRKTGSADHVKSLLQKDGIQAEIFSDVEANPSVETVEKAADAFRESGADFLIALGGGSPMDTAKAVGVVARYGGSITEYEGAHKVPGKIIPLIAIPTTAGSGSEVTAFSVITDHSRNYKLTVFSYELLPVTALLDPKLIATAPASVAASCGMDAFIHAMEAYVSKAASPFSEAMSEKAMELIGGKIRAFVHDRSDLSAAEAMMTGSLFAGIAFSYARLGNIHAMSHPVSAFFNVPHGVANSVLLPVIVEYNAEAAQDKFRKVCRYLVPEKVAEEECSMKMLLDTLKDLFREIGIPCSLKEAIQNASADRVVSEETIEKCIPLMAEDAMKSGNIAVNPRLTTIREVTELYHRAL